MLLQILPKDMTTIVLISMLFVLIAGLHHNRKKKDAENYRNQNKNTHNPE